jgi:hypothetical protein
MRSDIAGHLLEVIEEGSESQLWIGANPPFIMASIDIRQCAHFRGPSELHGKHSVVWLYEENLSSFRWDQQILVIDEAIRFLGSQGKLVIRYLWEGERSSIITVKNLIGRRFGIRAKVLSEKIEGNDCVTVFEIFRENIDVYQDKRWTFAILTEGNKVENVCQFLKSIRDKDEKFQHQIIVCGPQNDLYTKFQVEYHHADYSKEFGEISRKKNNIAKIAKNANLLLVHDRYRLEADFFGGFEKFGYDFDYLTIYQQFENGTEFPFWCTLSKRDTEMHWVPPIHLKDYTRVHKLHYLNGGLLIFKTKTLQSIPFNELLFWMQAEDVEVCYTYMQHGIPPRVNLFSSATTINTPLEKVTTVYVPERSDDNEHLHYSIRDKFIIKPKISFKNRIKLFLQKWLNRAKRRAKLLAALVALVIVGLQILTILIVILLGIR